MREFPVRAAWWEVAEHNADLFALLDDDQIEVFRSMFYSGVLWTILNVKQRMKASRGKPRDEDKAFFADVNREIDDFVNEALPTHGNA